MQIPGKPMPPADGYGIQAAGLQSSGWWKSGASAPRKRQLKESLPFCRMARSQRQRSAEKKTCRGTGRLSPALCENQRRKGTGAPDCVARDIKIKSKAGPPARATPSVESLRLLIAGFPITRSPDDPRIPPFASQRNGAPVCLVRERKSGQSLGHPASLDTRRSS